MKIYTVDEVAEVLEVSVKTIRRYIYAGKIGASKIGGQWRINQDQLDDYVRSTSSEHVCNNSCHSEVSQDDFCVFMDTDYFSSEDKLQLCTIIDYYSDTVEEITKLSEILSRVVTEDGVNGGQARYNYVYDQALNRARFVLWGNASFIEKATGLLRPFEGGSHA
ncbi:helix-turn-helix domain-containing protein [Acidaminobacter sp. JC074]|uniref:helix-turn-helix domain-containing protein n=1 Tax=Acidaminobacter sp. JC074 TaxID=2530199 RepID=UPI001F0ED327|nr:helix-turn-helix domain-containing protein [Acidaminobacter sp. JC074]